MFVTAAESGAASVEVVATSTQHKLSIKDLKPQYLVLHVFISACVSIPHKNDSRNFRLLRTVLRCRRTDERASSNHGGCGPSEVQSKGDAPSQDLMFSVRFSSEKSALEGSNTFT